MDPRCAFARQKSAGRAVSPGDRVIWPRSNFVCPISGDRNELDFGCRHFERRGKRRRGSQYEHALEFAIAR